MQEIPMPGGLKKPNRKGRSALADAQARESGRHGDRRDDGAGGDFRRAAANDNPGPEARIEDAAMRPARLLGRQIAREHLEASHAANDNAPTGEAGER